jgi:hypothetical protein
MIASILKTPAITCLSALALFFADDVKKAARPVAPEAKAQHVEPSPAHIRIVTYTMQISSDKAEELDRAELEESAVKPDGLKSALEKLGKPVLACIVDQDIDLAASPSITLSCSVPTPSGSQTFNGQTTTQVQYQSCGSVFRLRGKWDKDSDIAHVWIESELSYTGESKVRLSPDSFAPMFHSNKQASFGFFSSGKPKITLYVNDPRAAEGATAYVTQFVISRIAKPSVNRRSAAP